VGEFHYPQVETGTELRISGQVIRAAKLIEAIGVAEIQFEFTNGTLLAVQHKYSEDTMKLSIIRSGR
jgi:hypothetical protein